MKHFLISIIVLATLISCGGAEERKEVYLEKAKQSLAAGDLDKARIELKNVLQIDPNDAQAYFKLGDVFEQQKEYRKAFGNYSKALELVPDNLEYNAKIGSYYLMLVGNINKAIEKRDFILGKDASNIDGLLLKAGILLKQNDTAGAKKITQDIFSRQPGQIQNAMFLSSLYLKEKKYDDSINVLNRCSKKNPEDYFLISALANAYFEAGKYEYAESAYRKILEKNPNVYSNHLKLAFFYKEIGDSEKAENILRKAVEADASDAIRMIALVEFIQQSKGNKIAIDELKSLIVNNEEASELKLILAKFYLIENDLIEAEKIFKLLASEFPDNSAGIKAKVFLAEIYMQRDNMEAAVNVIEDAFKMTPNDSEVNFIKAKLQMINEDYEGVITSLRIVVKDDPEKIEAYFLLSSAHKNMGNDKQASEIINKAYENNITNINGLLKLANYYVKNNSLVEAEKVVDHCLSLDANDYEALLLKSVLLNERKMYSKVDAYTSHMIAQYPDMPGGYEQSVKYMLIDNRINEAIHLLEDGYTKVKANANILSLLVSLYISQNNFDVAIEKIRSAILDKGESGELYLQLANTQLLANKVEDAIASLGKAINASPASNESYLSLARIYTNVNNDNQKAISVLKRGLAESKGDAKLTTALAQIYIDIGDNDKAIGLYEETYKKNTSSAIIINNLAALLAEYRNDEISLKRAKDLADKIRNSNHPAILDTVGWVYYKIGDYAGALNILKNVVEKSPDEAIFNYHLGMALYKTGDETMAETYLSRSLANNSSFQGKTDAEALLKKLQ